MKADLETRTKWKKLVEAFLQSQKSYKVFCQEHNIKLHQLQYWMRKLKPKVIEPTQFTQIELKQEKSSPTIKLWIRKVAIEIPMDFDEVSLRRVIQVVDSLV